VAAPAERTLEALVRHELRGPIAEVVAHFVDECRRQGRDDLLRQKGQIARHAKQLLDTEPGATVENITIAISVYIARGVTRCRSCSPSCGANCTSGSAQLGRPSRVRSLCAEHVAVEALRTTTPPPPLTELSSGMYTLGVSSGARAARARGAPRSSSRPKCEDQAVVRRVASESTMTILRPGRQRTLRRSI
jgi:hypothetical protein